MSNAARKARKKSGEKFVRTAKIGTPVPLRVSNQARAFLDPNTGKQRFGITAAGRKRIADYLERTATSE